MKQLLITDSVVDLRLHDGCGDLRVSLGSFLQFAHQMNHDIESLVARLHDQATPAARLGAVLTDRHGLTEWLDVVEPDA